MLQNNIKYTKPVKCLSFLSVWFLFCLFPSFSKTPKPLELKLLWHKSVDLTKNYFFNNVKKALSHNFEKQWIILTQRFVVALYIQFSISYLAIQLCKYILNLDIKFPN